MHKKILAQTLAKKKAAHEKVLMPHPLAPLTPMDFNHRHFPPPPGRGHTPIVWILPRGRGG